MFCAFFVMMVAVVLVNSKPPNIVVLIADDLGIGDIEPYGNTTVKTPNLQRLADEGMKFTHHVAAAPTCTPSRAALLTGRLPLRYGLYESAGPPPVLPHAFTAAGLPQEEMTWVKVLQNSGYDTHLSGKWHLGWDSWVRGDHKYGPLSHGFNSFYGTPFTLTWQYPHPRKLSEFFLQPIHHKTVFRIGVALIIMLATIIYRLRLSKSYFVLLTILLSILWLCCAHLGIGAYYRVSEFLENEIDFILMRNKTLIEKSIILEGMSQRLVSESVQFINRQTGNKPFALVHSFLHPHTPMFSSSEFNGVSAAGRYGDNVEEMDAGVGDILKALDDNEIVNDTLVYFISDHGGDIKLKDKEGHSIGGYNGGYSGGKFNVLEGGIRVPGIMRWPSVIQG